MTADCTHGQDGSGPPNTLDILEQYMRSGTDITYLPPEHWTSLLVMSYKTKTQTIEDLMRTYMNVGKQALYVKADNHFARTKSLSTKLHAMQLWSFIPTENQERS